MESKASLVKPMPGLAVIGMAALLGACSHPATDSAQREPTVRVADAALSSGAPELALNIANIVLAKQPRDVGALVARGDALYAMGRVNDAQQSYRAAVTVDPSSVAGQIGLGRTLAHTDPQAAESAFTAALERDPGNVIALNNLGVTRDLEGRHAEAQEAYRHALTLSPDSSDVQMNLQMSVALAAQGPQSAQTIRDDGAQPRATPVLAPSAASAVERPYAAPAAAEANQARVPLRQSRAMPVVPTTPTTIDGDATPVAASAMPAISGDVASRLVASATPGQLAARPIADVPNVMAPKPAPEVASVTGPRGDRQDPYVQLASLTSSPDALLEWKRLAKRLPGLLTGREPTITSVGLHGRTYWRLRTFGFTDRSEADALCDRLKADGFGCWSGWGL